MGKNSTFTAHEKKNEAVIRAVTALGGARQAATRLGVSSTAVLKWIYRNCPPERAVQLEQMTGTLREEIRPDIFLKNGNKAR